MTEAEQWIFERGYTGDLTEPGNVMDASSFRSWRETRDEFIAKFGSGAENKAA
jgi:hypothetical protein